MTTAVSHLNELQAAVINRGAGDYSSSRAKSWALSSLVVASQRSGRSRVDSALRVVLTKFAAGSVKNQALALLEDLDRAVSHYDAADVHEFSAREHDDGSATIEMRFPDRRLAFTLEQDPRESGWHIVYARSSGGLQACGDLPATYSDLLILLTLATRRLPK